MSISYFEVTVPLFKKNLLITKALLKKGLVHATETGVSEADFLNQRLAPDMFPLLKQVQILTDTAKGAVARLTGTESTVVIDDETSIAELTTRLDTVVAYLETLTPEQFTTAAAQKITLPYIPGHYQTGADYVVDFVLPNFFFHMSIVYALMRRHGVTIGKMDFLGSLKLHPIE